MKHILVKNALNIHLNYFLPFWLSKKLLTENKASSLKTLREKKTFQGSYISAPIENIYIQKLSRASDNLDQSVARIGAKWVGNKA